MLDFPYLNVNSKYGRASNFAHRIPAISGCGQETVWPLHLGLSVHDAKL